MSQSGASALIPADASLPALQQAAASCQACDLWERTTQTVFGEGSARARVVLVGEPPGNEEDLAGRPFVGPAGRLLDHALAEAGIDRDLQPRALVCLGATAARHAETARFIADLRLVAAVPESETGEPR
jgi:uracil-DNA glycosylase